MANSIDDLKGFMEAVRIEWHYRHNRRLDCPSEYLEWLGSRLSDAYYDGINEQKYINQWVK